MVTIACPTFAPKITPYHGPITKPNYLPHSWTYPTHHPKLHRYPISCCATMHWTERHTQTHKWLEGMFDDYRPLSLYRERQGIMTAEYSYSRLKNNFKRPSVHSGENTEQAKLTAFS